MTPKEKAKELVEKYEPIVIGWTSYYDRHDNPNQFLEKAKQCAIIAVENEYYEKRELLFLLKSNRVITDDKAYLHFSDLLINEEQEVKNEIEKL